LTRNDGGVTGGPPDPWEPEEGSADLQEGDLLEGGLRTPLWRRIQSRVPREVRLLVLAVVVLLAGGAGALELRDRAADRVEARQVDLAVSLGLSSVSTTPPGGQVSFFVVVRNRGVRPVRITAVDGAAPGLRLSTEGDVDRALEPGAETAVPVSVRLTCPWYDGGAGLTTAVAVRREDGARVTRSARPGAAELLTDVATTLCGARPDLRDQELSGPVLGTLPVDGPDR